MEMKQEKKTSVDALTAERDTLDESFVNARQLLEEAIGQAKGGKKNCTNEKLMDLVSGNPLQVSTRVRIPVKEHPKFNFVGKLLGPKGSTLKQLQLDTGTRMLILGRNSMRDKTKEEEQRNSGDPQYAHLTLDLHVLVEAFCPAPEAYSRVGHALTELKKYLTPETSDDITQGQMMDMGMVRPASRGGAMGRGRGAPARGMPRPLGAAPRGGRPAPGARGASRGAVRGRGAPPGRGRAAPRPLAYRQEEEYYDESYGETYDEGAYNESYGEGTADEGTYGYAEGGAGDGYGGYGTGYRSGTAQSGSYGSQASSAPGSYGGYGSNGSSWSSGGAGAGRQPMKAPAPYGQKPMARSHPYARY